MRAMLLDLRQSIRGMVRAPLFTAGVVVLLALGIGANTLIFTTVDVLLLRPLGVAHPEQLAQFGVQLSPTYTDYVSPYLYGRMLRERAKSFSDVFVSWPMEMAFASGNQLESITGETVSGNYFSALGLSPQLGRLLADDDEKTDAPVAVLSDSFWRRVFVGRKDVIGTTIHLRGSSFTVIGVLANRFADLDLEKRPDVWVTMSAGKLWTAKQDNTGALSHVYMRLREGESLSQAEAEAGSLYPAMIEAKYSRSSGPGWTAKDMEKDKSKRVVLVRIERGISAMRKQFAGAVGVLMGAVGALLLLVCANTGGLLLARAETRRREIAIRISLGATRWTIVRQTLAEATLLSGAGALIGWFVAHRSGPLLVRFLPARRPLGFELTADLRVLAFATGACVLTAVLISVIPALRVSRMDPNTIMARLSGRASAPRAGRGLVAFQVALATVLVTGGIALVRTLQVMRAQDPGFRRDKLIVLNVNPRMAGVKSDEIPQVFEDVVRRAEVLPGVEGVSLADRPLMRGIGLKASVGSTGTRIPTDDVLNVSLNNVGLGHFANMGMRILEGRDFQPSDNAGKPQPSIVSASFARQFFPGFDPIGRTFGMGSPGEMIQPEYQIVGVVNDTKYRSMREIPPPTFYLLLDRDTVRYSDGMALHVRVRGEPATVIQELRQSLGGVGPGLAPTDVATMEQEIETSLWQERLLAALSSIFAALSAVLAGIGLFGMLAFAVSRRTREIGIRMAVGATVNRIVALFARETAWTVIPSILLGLGTYVACSRFLASVLYDVSPWDAVSLAGSTMFLIAIAAAAALLPSVRAARVEPLETLREE